jgi:hypothetical protein
MRTSILAEESGFVCKIDGPVKNFVILSEGKDLVFCSHLATPLRSFQYLSS